MSKGFISVNTIRLNELVQIQGNAFENLSCWSLRAGEAFTISDSEGRLFRARLVESGNGTAGLLPFEQIGTRGKDIEITLLQALPEKERMELVIQKTTELGVSSIIPFRSARSTSLEERESRQPKSHKWGKIALKAAKQCRRADIPEILDYRSFDEALSFAKDAQLKIALWELEKETAYKCALRKKPKARSIAILSGPEGGFTGEEISDAKKAGFITATLGKRVLRTETASIMAVGLASYELED